MAATRPLFTKVIFLPFYPSLINGEDCRCLPLCWIFSVATKERECFLQISLSLLLGFSKATADLSAADTAMPEERIALLPARNYVTDEGLMSRSLRKQGRSKIFFDVGSSTSAAELIFFRMLFAWGLQKIPNSYDYYYRMMMIINSKEFDGYVDD